MTFTEATFDLFEAKMFIPWRSTDLRKTKKNRKNQLSFIAYGMKVEIPQNLLFTLKPK